MNSPLEITKAAVYEACPELKHDCGGGHSCYYEGHPDYDPIHLEHILRAIHASDPASVYLISHAGTFARFHTIGAKQYTETVYSDEEETIPVVYDLTKSFEDQTEETKLFLSQLLTKE